MKSRSRTRSRTRTQIPRVPIFAIYTANTELESKLKAGPSDSLNERLGKLSVGFEWLCKHNRLRPEAIRFVKLDSEHAQSDGKSVNRGLPVLD